MSDFYLPKLFMALKDVEFLLQDIMEIQRSIIAGIVSNGNEKRYTDLLVDNFLRSVRRHSTTAVLDEYKEQFRDFIESEIRERINSLQELRQNNTDSVSIYQRLPTNAIDETSNRQRTESIDVLADLVTDGQLQQQQQQQCLQSRSKPTRVQLKKPPPTLLQASNDVLADLVTDGQLQQQQQQSKPTRVQLKEPPSTLLQAACIPVDNNERATIVRNNKTPVYVYDTEVPEFKILSPFQDFQLAATQFNLKFKCAYEPNKKLITKDRLRNNADNNTFTFTCSCDNANFLLQFRNYHNKFEYVGERANFVFQVFVKKNCLEDALLHFNSIPYTLDDGLLDTKPAAIVENSDLVTNSTEDNEFFKSQLQDNASDVIMETDTQDNDPIRLEDTSGNKTTNHQVETNSEFSVENIQMCDTSNQQTLPTSISCVNLATVSVQNSGYTSIENSDNTIHHCSTPDNIQTTISRRTTTVLHHVQNNTEEFLLENTQISDSQNRPSLPDSTPPKNSSVNTATLCVQNSTATTTTNYDNSIDDRPRDVTSPTENSASTNNVNNCSPFNDIGMDEIINEQSIPESTPPTLSISNLPTPTVQNTTTTPETRVERIPRRIIRRIQAAAPSLCHPPHGLPPGEHPQWYQKHVMYAAEFIQRKMGFYTLSHLSDVFEPYDDAFYDNSDNANCLICNARTIGQNHVAAYSNYLSCIEHVHWLCYKCAYIYIVQMPTAETYLTQNLLKKVAKGCPICKNAPNWRKTEYSRQLQYEQNNGNYFPHGYRIFGIHQQVSTVVYPYCNYITKEELFSALEKKTTPTAITIDHDSGSPGNELTKAESDILKTYNIMNNRKFKCYICEHQNRNVFCCMISRCKSACKYKLCRRCFADTITQKYPQGNHINYSSGTLTCPKCRTQGPVWNPQSRFYLCKDYTLAFTT
jgi:hypothetical protein